MMIWVIEVSALLRELNQKNLIFGKSWTAHHLCDVGITRHLGIQISNADTLNYILDICLFDFQN